MLYITQIQQHNFDLKKIQKSQKISEKRNKKETKIKRKYKKFK